MSWFFRPTICCFVSDIYMGKSSSFGKGRKNDNTLCSVTSSIRDGFHLGLLSLVMSNARTPKTERTYQITIEFNCFAIFS